jgi:hypothetical protein
MRFGVNGSRANAAFRNTISAALGRAKDGEERPSAVECELGDLLESLHMTALTDPAGDHASRYVGRRRAKAHFSKVTTFPLI